MDVKKQRLVAVIGAGMCDSEIYTLAEEAGKALAEAGLPIICGGLGGVMEAVCKGAAAAGGQTIGILPGEDAGDANPYVRIPITTGMGIGRNIIIIRSAAAVLAIDGKYGTLSEIAFALQLDKPVIGLNTWAVSDKIISVTNVSESINEILKIVDKL
jgi:uncharacterized protein (TIGR00725 family)